MKILRSIDGLLRAAFTDRHRVTILGDGISVRAIVVGSVVMGGIYGAMMGLYGGMRAQNQSWEQLYASAIKVPMLFLLTLIVAFPSLYVFSALAGSRIRFLETLRILLIAITINLAVLASLGPVTAFFTLSTDSYSFILLLNVLFFTIAGLVGLRFLLGALDVVFGEPSVEGTESAEESEQVADPSPPSIPANRSTRTIFRVWMLIYAVVGAQMAWILRPFIGNPDVPFTLFRERESNFFQAVLEQFIVLFS